MDQSSHFLAFKFDDYDFYPSNCLNANHLFQLMTHFQLEAIMMNFAIIEVLGLVHVAKGDVSSSKTALCCVRQHLYFFHYLSELCLRVNQLSAVHLNFRYIT